MPILHIDVDAMTIGTNYRTDVAMVGDARLGLEDLGRGVDVLTQAREVSVDELGGDLAAGRLGPGAQGDAMFSPAGQVHGVRNEGPDDAILLVYMAPHPQPEGL